MKGTGSGRLFPKFGKATRAENVYGMIREGILRGVWKPGEKISDLELSEQLGVSRISVREALSKFVENRVIEKLHWKGYRLRRLTWYDIQGILEVRMALETIAIGHVARRATPALIRELEEAIEQSTRDMEAGDLNAFRNSDFRFHEIIYRESGNPWIARVLENLRILIAIIRRLSQSEHFRETAMASIAEHRDVVRCLTAGDTEESVASLRMHISSHTKRVRAELADDGVGAGEARQDE